MKTGATVSTTMGVSLAGTVIIGGVATLGVGAIVGGVIATIVEGVRRGIWKREDIAHTVE